MKKVTPFFWFGGRVDEAAKFYVSVIKNSKILSDDDAGERLYSSVRVSLDGQELTLFHGGPHYELSPAVSLFVQCETQAEVDELWEKLSEGGEKSRCGWLVDKFGLSWQIIPTALMEMLGDPDDAKSDRVQEAMMGMIKIDIAALQRAYDGT